MRSVRMVATRTLAPCRPAACPHTQPSLPPRAATPPCRASGSRSPRTGWAATQRGRGEEVSNRGTSVWRQQRWQRRRRRRRRRQGACCSVNAHTCAMIRSYAVSTEKRLLTVQVSICAGCEGTHTHTHTHTHWLGAGTSSSYHAVSAQPIHTASLFALVAHITQPPNV